MEEKEKNAGGGDTAMRKQSFKEWLENFWYHYKWHSIVAVFLIITVTVCSVQMCSRVTYDIHITYAGYHEIKRTGAGGISPYGEAVTSLSKLCGDFDGDGEVNLSLTTLFVVNEAEKEALLGGGDKLEINEALVREDTNTLKSELLYGDQYVFFLSESIFREYERIYDGAMFRPLGEYADENGDFEFATEKKTGVYLRSLKIAKLPILCDLPDDTIVCMRHLSEVSQVFGKAQNEENYRRGIEFMKSVFAYK